MWYIYSLLPLQTDFEKSKQFWLLWKCIVYNFSPGKYGEIYNIRQIIQTSNNKYHLGSSDDSKLKKKNGESGTKVVGQVKSYNKI